MLLAGIYLFVPGVMDPENLRGPLTAGSLVILAGLFGLLLSRNKNRGNRRFDRAAEIMLQGKDQILPEHGISVSFDADGMTVASPDCEDTVVGYDCFETVVETADLYLIVYDKSALVLQKHDLSGTSAEDFSAFLAEHKYIHSSDT